MEFKSIIKAHGLNPWQFIYPKPNSHWQYQSPILIGNIKAQFSLALLCQKEKEPKIINAWQRKNIMVKCYHGKKDHGNHLIKKKKTH